MRNRNGDAVCSARLELATATTPSWVKPAHELYGEILLELERPAEAAAQFERSLLRTPSRTLSLRGLARASIATGDPDAAREQYQKIANQWRGGDDAEVIQEARAFLAES